MTKEERLTLIKQRHIISLDRPILEFGEMPVPEEEIIDEAHHLQAYQEEEQEKESLTEALTSDEV